MRRFPPINEKKVDMDKPSLTVKRIRVTLLLLITLLIALLYPWLNRGYEALLLLADMGGAEALPASYQSQPVMRRTIHLPGKAGVYVADLYQAERAPRAAIVLQHGAAEAGKDDQRLVRFARQLARARFTVIVPEMPGAQGLKVSSDEIPVLHHAVDYLQQSSNLPPGTPIGLGGFSIAAGLAIQAAMLPVLRERVDFILAVGGYYDLPITLDYMTTGIFYLDGERHQLQPNEYGKWVFVLSNIERIEDRPQRELMRRIAREKIVSPAAPVAAELVAQLHSDALHIYNYIVNALPEHSAPLRQRLPGTLQDEIRQLDLANKDLSAIRAKLLLVHGIDDNIIPYSQSIALQRALPESQSQLYLLENWTHVDPEEGTLDAWPMWRALYRLLELRDMAVS